MKLQKNYILLSFATLLFIGLMILLSILLFEKANIRPGAIWDAISFVIVNIGAYVLFMIAFGNVKKSNKEFFYYKLIWMQDMLVILGFLGIGLGFVFMVLGMLIPPPPGVDPTAKLIGSMAIALITTLYGVVFANLLLKPAAKKLEQKLGIYLYKDRLLLEGISMLPNKPHPIIIQNHLNSFLDPSIHFDVAGG